MRRRIEFGLLGPQSLKSVSSLVLWFFARVPKIIYFIVSRFKRILTIYTSQRSNKTFKLGLLENSFPLVHPWKKREQTGADYRLLKRSNITMWKPLSILSSLIWSCFNNHAAHTCLNLPLLLPMAASDRGQNRYSHFMATQTLLRFDNCSSSYCLSSSRRRVPLSFHRTLFFGAPLALLRVVKFSFWSYPFPQGVAMGLFSLCVTFMSMRLQFLL